MSDAEQGEMARPTVSTRDHGELRERLASWLAGHVHEPVISELVLPSSNGMSSETVLFEAEWGRGGERCREACAMRLPPSGAMPVFPVYDLGKQFRLMRLVGERSSVPVPRTLWFEPDEQHLGAPFFVMERVSGEVPPDVMPYTFGDCWFFEATDAQRARLQRASIEVLGRLHAIELTTEEVALLTPAEPGDTPLRRHFASQVAYYDWIVGEAGVRSPVVDRTLEWIEANWPADEGEAVLSWGDARIGNMMYRDFEPVAVFDWEMAAVGPREIDLGWMVFLHRFFQDLAEQMGLPGLPDFMRLDEVAATYEDITGYTPRDLEFFTIYAALRHAIVMTRIGHRSVHFGEAAPPENPDDLVYHAASLHSMLDGTYWTPARR